MRARPTRGEIEPVGPGEESVWDFPRPPAVQPVDARLRVEFAGETVAETTRGRRVIETAGAPVYYIPRADVREDLLRPNNAVRSMCEWKGSARYYDLVLGERVSPAAAFAYPNPTDAFDGRFLPLHDHVAFYAARIDAAYVGAEAVTPQPGGFYAGWVTASLRGPIKGAPGTEGW